MEITELLNKIKDNISEFIERYDDFFFDIHPCAKCHDDMNICPNTKCRVNSQGCDICNNTFFICKNCNKDTYEKYEEYFILVNGIAANPQKFTSEEVVVLLEEAIQKVKEKK